MGSSTGGRGRTRSASVLVRAGEGVDAWLSPVASPWRTGGSGAGG